jgi:hypothetical protein
MCRALLPVLLLLACTKQPAEVKEVSVEEVAAFVKAGTATVCDANDDEYRKGAGFVPGAVLLTNFAEYDVKAELPADKARQLVFYCTSRT